MGMFTLALRRESQAHTVSGAFVKFSHPDGITAKEIEGIFPMDVSEYWF